MTQEYSTGLLSSDPLLSLLEGVRVGKSSLIRVTGPSGLSALLWLCRHGFERVGYVKPGSGGPHEEADALIIAHTCDEPALARLLATGPHVREGGVLFFRSHLPNTDEGLGPDLIHGLLQLHGYVVEKCMHGSHRELHVARRAPRQWLRAA
ncbi:MAG: hypothetical protein JWO72_1217 [Caulobacteraceae bacterium]|nr:hypothetical protein [Caulobacteraceae bacterium]